MVLKQLSNYKEMCWKCFLLLTYCGAGKDGKEDLQGEERHGKKLLCNKLTSSVGVGGEENIFSLFYRCYISSVGI